MFPILICQIGAPTPGSAKLALEKRILKFALYSEDETNIIKFLLDLLRFRQKRRLEWLSMLLEESARNS
jgi:hypothetical protein